MPYSDPEKAKANKLAYYQKNKDRIKAAAHARRVSTLEAVREYDRMRGRRDGPKKRRKRADNPQAAKADEIRSQLRSAISHGHKPDSWFLDLLGCTWKDFLMHIEKQFVFGMSWETRGYRTWHLDHIKPLCSFDLLNDVQLAQACHYSNVQPLWALDNLRKGGR